MTKSIDESHGRDGETNKSLGSLEGRVVINESKIRKLEDWRLYILGAAAVIGVIGEAVYQYIARHFGG
jgi:hypothetical protein